LPRKNRTPANKRKLNQDMVRRVRARARTFLIWDTYQRGLVLQVRPSGHKAWKAIYSHRGRPRWYHLGNAGAIKVNDARKLASRIMFNVAEGKDPAAERKAHRSKGTFEELAERYVAEYSRRKNKSWQQPDKLVRKHLLPRWGKLHATAITRSDVKAAAAAVTSPSVRNQTLAAVSAIFAWGIREDILTINPCALVERNETKSRERVLSDSEIPKFWAAFDNAGLLASSMLKLILLTGQRPGEVAHMHRAQIVDGWWEMPGAPVPALDWPGTKNGHSHRIWLPAPAQALLADLSESGALFVGARGKTIIPAGAMASVCGKFERATPHDLRRTHGTTITALGFGRDAMNRIQNHVEGGIASVYDRHQYATENKRIMEAVATRIMALVNGEIDAKVVAFRQA
jgi:integrase